MYRLALRITLNSQEAEDVVQDVIIKVWQRRNSLTDVENLEAYLLRMTHNLALDRQRMRVNQMQDIDGMDFIAETIDTTDERIDNIRKVMTLLPTRQREAMQLRDFEGRSYKEIADIMQMTEEQVKISIYRARQFVKSKVLNLNS
jgi:RNA polymerase sigma-70 factor (ECF subfamily)